MQKLVQSLNTIKGVKNTKKEGVNVLRVNLFISEIPGSDAVEIKGDLRKIAPKIRNKLEEHRKNGGIRNWEWVNKPEKKYTETKLGKGKTADRREKGHRPGYYKIAVQK